MKKLVYISSVVCVVLIVACSAVAVKQKAESNEALIIDLTKKLIQSTHYNQLLINDEFSQNAFNALLDNIDPNKRFLLQKDVDELSKFKFKIDDAINNKDLALFDAYQNLIEKREASAEKEVAKILSKPINLEFTDSIELDADKHGFCTKKKELDQRWEHYITSRVVNELYYKVKKQEENDTVPQKSLTELEVEAREKVAGQMQDWFKRLSQLERADRFSVYMNSILQVYGPHTNFYPPKDKEDFDINMSGKLEGIGATLTVKDGYIKVSKIVAGSASWKQGDLKAGDLIIAVAQGDSTPVDVVNMRLDKAVRLIRGPKGTEVRLTVKKVDRSVVNIPIIRDVVVIEETYAKSLVLKQKDDSLNYGYINLASFYAEFGKRNGKRCSIDVLRQIEALKNSDAQGIILDLRNNGGGSLSDAVDMVGYFIKTGPVVQVDGAGREAESYKDRDPDQQFKKPLVVMINSYSASASEIFAAAIQDYGRGVIVGTNSFGKGTVQRFFGLDEVAQQFRIKVPGEDLGAVKQTIAKFFRINGGATQLKGVAPDIVLPDVYELIEIGEKEYDYALAWSSISPADYVPFDADLKIDSLNKLTTYRTDTSAYFQSVRRNAEAIKKSRDMTKLPLNFEEYKIYKGERKAVSDSAKVKDVAVTDMFVEFNQYDAIKVDSDTILKTRLTKFQEETQKDHYIRESLRILSDLVKIK